MVALGLQNTSSSSLRVMFSCLLPDIPVYYQSLTVSRLLTDLPSFLARLTGSDMSTSTHNTHLTDLFLGVSTHKTHSYPLTRGLHKQPSGSEIHTSVSQALINGEPKTTHICAT